MESHFENHHNMRATLSRQMKQAVGCCTNGSNSFNYIQVYPISGCIGAEIEGVDLTRKLSRNVVDEIRSAFLQHGVIFFRRQNGLSPSDHLNLSRYFGSIQRHPIVQGMSRYPDIIQIVKEPGTPTKFGEEWHSDHTFMQHPPFASILVARELPEYGNDTIFNCMQSAYEGFSNGMKEMISKLNAVHTTSVAFSPSHERQDNFNGSSSMKYGRGNDHTAIHPVVRLHEETGREILFVNPMFTQQFEHMTVDESQELLRLILRNVYRPEYQCRFRWSPGSVAFWDNRRLQHIAINDNWKSRRVMHRITIEMHPDLQ